MPPPTPSPIPASLCAPLFEPLTALRGVGETVAALIARAAGGTRVIDLLFHLPESWIDRRTRTTIAEAVPGALATIEVEVVRIDPPGSARQPTKAVVTDGSGFADLVFFQRFPAAKLPKGGRVLVSGRFDDRRQIVHPDHIVPADRAEGLPWIEPVWGADGGAVPLAPAQTGGAGAGAHPGVAGMARSGAAGAGEMAGVCRGAALLHAPAGAAPTGGAAAARL